MQDRLRPSQADIRNELKASLKELNEISEKKLSSESKKTHNFPDFPSNLA